MSRNTGGARALRVVSGAISLAIAGSFLVAASAQATPGVKIARQCPKPIVAKCPKGQHPGCVQWRPNGCCRVIQCVDR